MQSQEKKILALPGGEFFELLKKIYIYVNKELGYKIYVLTRTEYLKPYADFIASPEQLIFIPSVLKRSPWETIPEEIEKIRHIMSESEKLTKIPTNRILLANERTLGRAYARDYYYWPERKLTKRVLQDNTLAETVVMRMFKFAYETIHQYAPMVCLGAPTGGLVNTVFFMVAKYCHVPYIACNSSLVTPARHFWSSTWGSFNTDIAKKYEEKLIQNELCTVQSLRRVEAFQQKPEAPINCQTLWIKTRQQDNLLKVNKNIFNRFMYRAIPLMKRLHLVDPKPFFSYAVDLYRSYFLRRMQKRFYQRFSSEVLSCLKYIYYPFHVDPEIVLNVMAPTWHNQLNTIKMLSYNLPTGYKLLVREHRLNVGRRSNQYLEAIRLLPGVVWIDAYDDQYKYINHASLVVTVNGTSGFEAIQLQKPVLTLDRTFYDGLNIAKRANDYPDLGAAMLDTMTSWTVDKTYNEKIALFVDAENEVTLSMDAAPADELFCIQNKMNESVPNLDPISLEATWIS